MLLFLGVCQAQITLHANESVDTVLVFYQVEIFCLLCKHSIVMRIVDVCKCIMRKKTMWFSNTDRPIICLVTVW